jgi:carbamoyl-phosphate synthase large subunit
VPLATDLSYVTELLTICQAEQVRLLIPTIDDELATIAAAREQFKALSTVVACSPAETATICNDKYETCTRLIEAGVPAAKSYLPVQLTEDMPLPLFVKPRVGRGAIGAFTVTTPDELDFFLRYVPTPIVQEYLQGPEFTIDVLCGFDGKPLSIVPRERVVIRAGVSDRGRTVNDPRLIRLAEEACAALPFAGPINIQCRMRYEQPAIFEINPRFSGGIPLTIQAGADFPAMLIKLAMGRRVDPVIGSFKNDLWMTSFESSFFVDGATIGLAPFGGEAEVGEVA